MTAAAGGGDSTGLLAVAEPSPGLRLCRCGEGAVSPAAADWVLTQGCNSASEPRLRKAEVVAEASGRSWEAVMRAVWEPWGGTATGRGGLGARPRPLPVAQARCGLLAVRSPAAGQRAGRRDPTWALDPAR